MNSSNYFTRRRGAAKGFVQFALGSLLIVTGLLFAASCKNPFYPDLGNKKPAKPALVTLTVYFNPNGGNWNGSTADKAETIDNNRLAARPDAPSRQFHTFNGWYTEEGVKWDFNTSITADITLYAGWAIANTSDLAAYLAGLPPNGPGNPYTIKLDINDLGGGFSINGSLGYLLHANGSIYVNLDLSGSEFTDIVDESFFSCTNLTGITIPNSVTRIGNYTFGGCTNLETLTIGNKVTVIGWEAYMNCTSLKSIVIPDSVILIGGAAFDGCTSLESVTFEGTFTQANFQYSYTFPGDLRDRFFDPPNTTNGTPGTYTRTPPNTAWTKQP